MSREIYDDETEIIHYSDGYDAPGDYFDPPSVGNTGLTAGRRSRNGGEDTRKFAKRIPAGQNPYAVTQRASITTDHALIAQGSQRPQREPGPYYQEYDINGKLKPRRPRVQPQPARQPQRVTTGKQRHTDQSPVQRFIVVSKGVARTLIISGCVAGTLALIPIGGVVGSNVLHVARQQQQGVTPHIALSKIFGHNHDSIEHPTILRAMVSGDYIDFEEVPAGDFAKVHGFQTESLKDLGYTGDLSEVYLELTVEHVGAGKIQIRLTATIGGVGAWPFVQAISTYWILQDNGDFFVPPTNSTTTKK